MRKQVRHLVWLLARWRLRVRLVMPVIVVQRLLLVHALICLLRRVYIK